LAAESSILARVAAPQIARRLQGGLKLLASSRKPPGFLNFSGAYNHGDGTVSFQMNREDGAGLAACCPVEQLADIIIYFCQMARLVSEEAAMISGPVQVSLAPLDVDGLGIGVGPDPDKTMIVARLGGFLMTLAVPNTGLAEFGREMSTTIATLSVPRDRKN
jgi:hypothetical protein